MTIEQLEESFNKHEYGLFSNRDKFDIVVVYDESSLTLGGHDSPLSSLVRLIGSRSNQKVLRREPMLLVGGLKAWRQEYSERTEGQAVSALLPSQSLSLQLYPS